MTSTAPLAQGWLTADQCDALAPDVHHFGSTVGNLEDIYDVSVELRYWLYAPIDPAQVDPIQLIDDPNDDDGHAKFERIRAAVTRHERMPPVIVMHQPNESEVFSPAAPLQRGEDECGCGDLAYAPGAYGDAA